MGLYRDVSSRVAAAAAPRGTAGAEEAAPAPAPVELSHVRLQRDLFSLVVQLFQDPRTVSTKLRQSN